MGNRTLAYDWNGNLTSDTGGASNVANSWNYRNELTGTTIVSGGQTSVNYGYDSAGQRIFLREQIGSNVTSTNFPTSSYSETTKPDGTVERTVSIEAVGLPVATIRTVGTSTPEVFATHTDHLRSTRLVTRNAGQDTWEVAEQTDYDSFGKITRHEQTGDFAEKKKFTSHEFDAATSYTYAKARYLETSFGRFLSQDPAFIAVGDRAGVKSKTGANLEQFFADPQLLNSYGYARNNPITFVDPTGELPTPSSFLRSIGAKFVPIFAIASIAYDTFKPTPLANDYEMQLAQQNGNGSGANEQGNGITQEAGNGSAATAVSVVGSAAANGPNVNPGLRLGQKFGPLGKVAENTTGKLTSFTSEFTAKPFHGLERFLEKGLTIDQFYDTLRDPLVTLKQAGGNTLRLSKEAVVVLDKAGGLVTTYSKDFFKTPIFNILKLLK